MKKIIAALFLLYSAASFGLADASAPTKIQIPFGNSAGGSYIRTIPVASQIGIQNGAASFTDGFPPLNFVPVNAGGVPPFGQDMNGIFFAATAIDRWVSAGGPFFYDSTYQTAIGGYPKGACVQSTVTTARIWCSTVDNNVTNPDTGGAGWQFQNDAVNLSSATGTIANGVTATTQASTDSSIKVATTAFVQSATIGNGQTLQNMTGGSTGCNGSRNSLGATTCTNSTGRPIVVYVSVTQATNSPWALYAVIGGAHYAAYSLSPGTTLTNVMAINFIVPNGTTYSVSATGTPTLSDWEELK